MLRADSFNDRSEYVDTRGEFRHDGLWFVVGNGLYFADQQTIRLAAMLDDAKALVALGDDVQDAQFGMSQ